MAEVLKEGDIVRHKLGGGQMVILWIDEEKKSAQCRERTEDGQWHDEMFFLVELDSSQSHS